MRVRRVPLPDYHRYPAATAVVCLVVLALLLVVAANAERLPLIGGGTIYRAEFGDVSGLAKDAEVRVAGVKVGHITGMDLKDDHVEVSFTAGNIWLGDRTGAAIKLGNLLGEKYLSLDPLGAHKLESSAAIPRNRTVSVMDVTTVLQEAGRTAGGIDTRQLAQSFQVLSETFRDTPGEVQGAMRGLSALSTTISSRDADIRRLVDNTNQVARLAVSRNQEFDRLLSDGNVLLGELRQRRDMVRTLLAGTQSLSVQLTGLVRENAAQIGPMLKELVQVSAQLARNQDNLDRSLRLSGPMFRLISNTFGNGRWVDVYVCGLLPPNFGPVNRKGCTP